MLKTKNLVYAASKSQLLNLFDEFKKCELVKKYPKYLAYIHEIKERTGLFAIGNTCWLGVTTQIIMALRLSKIWHSIK